MPVNHIPIDGLWRCLCPSFDSLALSLAARHSSRPQKASEFRLRPRIRPQAREFTTTRNCKNEESHSPRPTFKDSSATGSQHKDILRNSPRNVPLEKSKSVLQPSFSGVAESRKHVQDARADERVLQRLLGFDTDGQVPRSREGFKLGAWGDVGSATSRLGRDHGQGNSAPVKPPPKKVEKKDKVAYSRKSEPLLVEMGPAKWGTMSFGRQSPTPSQSALRSTAHTDQQGGLESRESSVSSWKPTPVATHNPAEQDVSKGSPKSITAAFEVYQRKKANAAEQGIQMAGQRKSWDAEEVADLHDKLRAYRMEEGQYDRVVELVEYLLVERGEAPALVHYDSLIRANADAEKGSAECVRALLEEMKDEGIKGDSGFYHAVLQALAIHPDYALRAEIMQEMKERWFGLSPEGWHSLVVGLLRDRQLEVALDRLEEMHTDEILVQPWLYDIFTYILCENGEHDEAFNIMMHRYEQARFGITPSHWQYLLDTFSQACHYEATKQIWETRVQAADLIPSDGTCLAVLNIAAQHSDPALATSVIRTLSTRGSPLGISHYEALIAAYIGSQDINSAFRVLAIMERAGLNPTSASTRPLFARLSKSEGVCHTAWNSLITLRKDGHIIPITAINVLLEGLCSQNQVEQAFTYYKRLHEICPRGPNIETMNVVLQGLQRNPSSSSVTPAATFPYALERSTPKSKAMFLASEMRALKIKPDMLTYDRLIRICLLDGSDYEDAFRYLEEMEEVGRESVQKWWMRPGTANRMVVVCVKGGDLNRAHEIMGEMKKRGIAIKKSTTEAVELYYEVERAYEAGEL